MTITIPTGDLVGILSDVAPFACPDPELPNFHAVRLEWDGELLHAMALDGTRIAWSTWSPDDQPDDDERQDSMFAQPGGDDLPWAVNLSLPDAVELAKVYKLPAKRAGAPLTLDITAAETRLTVSRDRDTGHTEHTMTVQSMTDVQFPDIRKVLAEADVVVEAEEMRYSGRLLADFGAKVRQRDTMLMRFGEKLTVIEIGSRFVGAIAQAREPERLAAAA